MKIGQVSSSPNAADKLAAIITFILAEYKIFQFMEFALEPATFNSYPAKEDVGGNNSVREVNGALNSFVFSPSTGSGTQKAYGYENFIDQLYLNDLENGIATPEGLKRQIENEQIRLAKKVAKEVLYDMINGDGTGGTIYGLKNLVKDTADETGQSEYLGITKAQLYSALVQVGMVLDLNSEVSLRQFEEVLMRELASMGGNPVLVMNNYLFARMTSVAKKLGVYGVSTSDFGKPVDLFGNTPMIPVPLAMLPNTENDGEHADCTSLYAIEYNEADGFRYATNAGFRFTDFENLETKPSGKGRLEFYGQTKLEDVKKVRRFSRIRL